MKPYGACRLCLVEVVRGEITYDRLVHVSRAGRDSSPTKTENVLRARRMMIELILAMCPGDKLIQDMAKEMGVTGGPLQEGRQRLYPLRTLRQGLR